jgi:cytidylate kinase
VAAHAGVRVELVSRQREWIRSRGGGVVEGRDIGSEVWPDAELKVYLTADLSVRAARRKVEMAAEDRQEVADDLARRDTLDSSRAASPLRQADGAVVIDTTDLAVDEIVDRLLAQLP